MAKNTPLPELKTIAGPPDLLARVSKLFIHAAQLSEQSRLLKEEQQEVARDLLGCFAVLGVNGCAVEDWIAYRWIPRQSHLSAELLVEHGVDPAVIEACTKRTESPETVTVKPKGKKGQS